MSKLQDAVARLSGLLTPPVGYTNEAKIFAPEPNDSRRAFKQVLIDQAHTTLGLGQAALGGLAMTVPYLDNGKFMEIEALLADDIEQRDFHELANAIQSVADAINRPAT